MMKMSLPSVCSSMCFVRFCRELNCRLHSLQKSCLKSKPTDSLVVLGRMAAAREEKDDDDDNDGAAFGLDGASASFTFTALGATETPLVGPALWTGDGAGLLSTSSSSSEGFPASSFTASSFTRTLLPGPSLAPLLLGAAGGAEGGGVAADLLLLPLYILWTMRMCLFNMS